MLRVLKFQVGIGTVIAAALWGVYGPVHGYSAFLGCLVAALPNAFLALRLSVSHREKGAKGLLRAAYIGELGKIALTVLLFSVVFVAVKPLSAAALIATFIVTTLVPLLGLALREEQKDTVDNHGK